MACCGKPREDFKNKVNLVKENNMANINKPAPRPVPVVKPVAKPVVKPVVVAVKKPKSLEELIKMRKDARNARIAARNARIAARNGIK